MKTDVPVETGFEPKSEKEHESWDQTQILAMLHEAYSRGQDPGEAFRSPTRAATSERQAASRKVTSL